jgi:hypothetical protein
VIHQVLSNDSNNNDNNNNNNDDNNDNNNSNYNNNNNNNTNNNNSTNYYYYTVPVQRLGHFDGHFSKPNSKGHAFVMALPEAGLMGASCPLTTYLNHMHSVHILGEA